MQTWHQIRSIAARLTGGDQAGVDPGALVEPWRTVYARLETLLAGREAAASEQEARFLLWQATEGMAEKEALMARLAAALAGAQVSRAQPRVFQSLQALVPQLRPIEWLWPGWLPRGLLSLLGAAPGAGKSLVALDWARRVIAGEAWPDGEKGGTEIQSAGRGETQAGGVRQSEERVVWVDAEAMPQLLSARAGAWGMDLSRLFTLLPPAPYGTLDLGEGAQQDRLVELVEGVRPELVIVDSLSSITRKGENNVEEVRAILSFLASLAREQNVALLLIHHLRKPGRGMSARSRGLSDVVTAHEFRGSGHIIATARSVVALSVIQGGPKPSANSRRRLEVVKSNLGAHPPAIGVRFEPDRKGAPVVVYDDEPAPCPPATQVDECAEWLVEMMAKAGGPVRPKDVVARAAEMGFNRAAVYRTRKRLEGVIRDSENKYSPQNCWVLGKRER